jgi:hypothetical protein
MRPLLALSCALAGAVCGANAIILFAYRDAVTVHPGPLAGIFAACAGLLIVSAIEHLTRPKDKPPA